MVVVDEELEMMQYLFDLQGYLVIENALSDTEVSELNALLDERGLPKDGKRFGSAPE